MALLYWLDDQLILATACNRGSHRPCCQLIYMVTNILSNMPRIICKQHENMLLRHLVTSTRSFQNCYRKFECLYDTPTIPLPMDTVNIAVYDVLCLNLFYSCIDSTGALAIFSLDGVGLDSPDGWSIIFIWTSIFVSYWKKRRDISLESHFVDL